MTSDPLDVMRRVVEQEASLLQAVEDDDLLEDARAIAEAEQQRTRLRDRLEAARGMPIRVSVPGETLCGVLIDSGIDLVVLESETTRALVSLSQVTALEGLPLALREEGASADRVQLTWSAAMRTHVDGAPLQFTLVDGTCLRVVVDSVGADHVDLRGADRGVRTVPLAAIRSVVSRR